MSSQVRQTSAGLGSRTGIDLLAVPVGQVLRGARLLLVAGQWPVERLDDWKVLARARATTEDSAITYTRADLEHLQLPEASFDLVYSSLAFHYIERLEALLAGVHRALVPGGRLVCSVEHPIYTAPTAPGWSVDAAGHKTWPVDAYLNEGARSTDWLTKGVIKQHRTLATYINLLLRLGFALTHVEEWGPSAQQILARSQLADEHERPPFLLVAARR